MKPSDTPLWLNLKSEYIDDNFEALLRYLRDYAVGRDKDSFYATTAALLAQRVAHLLQDCSERPLYEGDLRAAEESDPQRHSFPIRLLGAYLLVRVGDSSESSPSDEMISTAAYLQLLTFLMEEQRKYAPQLMQQMTACLHAATLVTVGYGWNDLIDYQPDLFAYKVAHHSGCSHTLRPLSAYVGHGTLFIDAPGVYLVPAVGEKSHSLLAGGADSLLTDSGIALRTPAAEKLRQSQERSLQEIYNYVGDFLQSISSLVPTETVRRRHHYSDGDSLIVRITDIETDGTIHVATVDNDYEEIQGKIYHTTPSIMYYYTNTLGRYLHVGDCFPAILTDVAAARFSIAKTLTAFIVEECRRIESESDADLLIPATLIDVRPRHMVWLTQDGIPVYTNVVEGYVKFDYAGIIITEIETGDYYGKIDGRVEERITDIEDRFSEPEARRDCITRFGHSGFDILEKVNGGISRREKADSPVVSLSADFLRLLLRWMVTYQKTLLKPSERFRYLMQARIIAAILGEKDTEDYLRFLGEYLMILVRFAAGEDIREARLTPTDSFRSSPAAAVREHIVELLKYYGDAAAADSLAQTISRTENSDPIIARLARLVQTANTMRNILPPAALELIKREMIHTLSLETENDTDIEDEGREYLGVESGTQEFKTSVVFPSDNNMQPNAHLQMTHVLQGLCAFLNADGGGTLYVGVNDQGYVTGLAQDMNYLHFSSPDQYMRYIQDEAIRRFGTDVAAYLRFELLYDGRCVAIHVDSYPYAVVTLDDEAYLRINAESRKMPSGSHAVILQRKFVKEKGTMTHVYQLQHAIAERRTVVLHDYHSSSGGRVCDRRVEPYDIRPSEWLVVAYDIDRGTTRVFNIRRITRVEITDSPWQNISRHTPVLIDDFHMTGAHAISVCLRLDLFARNLLIEEYPAAAAHVTPDKVAECWYYTADVYSLEGIGRYYMGVAAHITIMEAEGLQEYVHDYAEKYLMKY
jgi:hypothetical protein